MKLDLSKSIICYAPTNNKSNIKCIALVEMPEEIRINNCLYGYLFVMKNGYCRLDYNDTVYDNSLNPNRLSKWYHQALLMKVTE